MNLEFRVEAVAEIDSTNDEVKRRADKGAAAGLVLRAGLQTAGRGRRGRQWISEPGNLYVSLLLRPGKQVAEAATIGFVTAIALGRVVRPLVPVGVSHKWPNDVLAGGRKISGILLESGGLSGGRVDWLVVGIGLNLVHHPQSTLYPTTDLASAGGPRLAPEAALDAFLAEFGPLYEDWNEGGFPAVRTEWLAHCSGLGETVLARLEREELRGRFQEIDEAGALVMALSDGTTRRIAAGDVFVPAD